MWNRRNAGPDYARLSPAAELSGVVAFPGPIRVHPFKVH